jgi:hypothetical protein
MLRVDPKERHPVALEGIVLGDGCNQFEMGPGGRPFFTSPVITSRLRYVWRRYPGTRGQPVWLLVSASEADPLMFPGEERWGPALYFTMFGRRFNINERSYPLGSLRANIQVIDRVREFVADSNFMAGTPVEEKVCSDIFVDFQPLRDPNAAGRTCRSLQLDVRKDIKRIQERASRKMGIKRRQSFGLSMTVTNRTHVPYQLFVACGAHTSLVVDAQQAVSIPAAAVNDCLGAAEADGHASYSFEFSVEAGYDYEVVMQ